MNCRKKLSAVGTEDFSKLRKNRYYYVDKTGLISELLRRPAEVTLFTRPRRFGKTLNMSMLKYFFEMGNDPALFEGLKIMEAPELCRQYMGKYPVIFLSLKDAAGDSFQAACRMAAVMVSVEASRFDVLRNSPRLTEEDRELYARLIRRDMDPGTLCSSLWDLSRLLEKHYGSKVILLIDEYDVPLQKAFYGGYYEQMADLIRSMFSQALKTNASLEFAVLTGCLRISRESIFTGMNNLRVLTASDVRFEEHFGFTDEEVREILEYYGLSDAYGAVREWYDGYRFGSRNMYCPWDVMNYVDLLLADPQAQPENFWANSSDNDAVREFVYKLNTSTARQELAVLADGGTIRKEIHQELTYRDMYSTVDNLWSLLYMTGYLTARERPEGRMFTLAIPNMEMQSIFSSQIMSLFRKEIK